MNSAELSKAIRERVSKLREAVDYPGVTDDAELLLVLARIIEGKPVGRAFGGPGYWGYNSPIGRALAASGNERPASLPNFMGIAGDQGSNSRGST